MIDTKIGVSGGRFFAFRLAPGEELLGALRRIVAANGIRAGYVAGVVGSLSRACLRFAGRHDGTVLDGCFEVVSLVGTLDAEGEHLHMTIANPEGTTTGGARAGGVRRPDDDGACAWRSPRAGVRPRMLPSFHIRGTCGHAAKKR